MVIIYISLIIFNLLFLTYYSNIQKIFNIFDFPDNKRKKQKKKVPITGGLLIVLNYILIILLNSFFKLDIFDYLQISKINWIFLFLVFPIVFYLIGLYDDKYNLKPSSKFLLSLILFYIVIQLDKNYLLDQITIESIGLNISIVKFSIFVTLLCYLLFQHAYNMFDGINLQIGFYSLFFLFSLFFMTKINIFIILILPLLFFLILNFKNKSYMGDGGCYFISYFLSIHCVLFYNTEKINSEAIFLLMMIPGIDMFRLFIYRILHGGSPFSPDNKHLHHYLTSNFSYIIANLISMTLIIVPLVIYLLLNNFLILIILTIIIYSFILYLITKKL